MSPTKSKRIQKYLVNLKKPTIFVKVIAKTIPDSPNQIATHPGE